MNAAWIEYSGLSFEETARVGWLDIVHPIERVLLGAGEKRRAGA